MEAHAIMTALSIWYEYHLVAYETMQVPVHSDAGGKTKRIFW